MKKSNFRENFGKFRENFYKKVIHYLQTIAFFMKKSCKNKKFIKFKNFVFINL